MIVAEISKKIGYVENLGVEYSLIWWIISEMSCLMTWTKKNLNLLGMEGMMVPLGIVLLASERPDRYPMNMTGKMLEHFTAMIIMRAQ